MRRSDRAWAIVEGGATLALACLLWVQTPAPALAETHHVGMNNRTFAPEALMVKVGDTVEWVNDDQDIHLVISGENLDDPNKGKPLDSGSLLPGQRYSFRFTAPGRYPYMCVIHWSLQSITGKSGMLGEVVVEP